MTDTDTEVNAKADAPAEQPIPKLASDTRRAWVTTGLVIVPAFLFELGLQIWNPDRSQLTVFTTSFFVIWILFSLMYVALVLRTFRPAKSDELHRWLGESAPRETSSRFWLYLSGGSGVSFATQGSIFAVLAVLAIAFVPELRSSLFVVILGIATVAGSWLLNSIAFTLQYARLNADTRSLVFPGDADPIFIDYFFLSVQVSTAFTPSDVVVTTTQLRRTMIAHSIIAFAFNTIIIAILVSGLISAAQ